MGNAWFLESESDVYFRGNYNRLKFSLPYGSIMKKIVKHFPIKSCVKILNCHMFLKKPCQKFLRYAQIFKIAIFGHETWPLAKVLEIAQKLSSYPRGPKWSLVFALRATVSEIQAHFQNCHIFLGMKLGHWPKFQKLHIYSHSTPEGPNQAYFPLCAAVSELWGWFSKL